MPVNQITSCLTRLRAKKKRFASSKPGSRLLGPVEAGGEMLKFLLCTTAGLRAGREPNSKAGGVRSNVMVWPSDLGLRPVLCDEC
ncbi:unnamed protein product [Protopolystoma xenopodis]|uniref:Uncharacterized protein n=1 Tax=Protopolystoma xenopodis TaxID=117903 RepID=A0A448X2I5_9PLAT|nr:unnamed protein product [Protopolystoma xenopodis]